ncbi:MAG: hypothetical protein D4R77_02700 [Planctomycetaceae bacterium]|nr:MAG: hypothetical protein D4R77_02700 [Planctomycetaceae bacterium]
MPQNQQLVRSKQPSKSSWAAPPLAQSQTRTKRLHAAEDHSEDDTCFFQRALVPFIVLKTPL